MRVLFRSSSDMSTPPPGTLQPPPERPELPAGVVGAGMPIATWSPLVAWLGGFWLFFAASLVAIIPAAFGGLSDDPAPLAPAASTFVQIGRASCRARVCPYVSLPVGT